jgi:hypothetical protein
LANQFKNNSIWKTSPVKIPAAGMTGVEGCEFIIAIVAVLYQRDGFLAVTL